MRQRKKLAIVIPIYGNDASLAELHRQLNEALKDRNVDLRFVFVNDRSPDRSQKILEDLAKKDPRVNVLLLSKNHGAFVAIIAGLNHVQDADAVVIMSADLQDPPQKIPELISQWELGTPVVLGVRERRNDHFLSKFFAGLFHKLFRMLVMPEMPEGGFDFCLIDRKVVDVLIRASEKNTNLTGLIIWAGFERAFVPYVRAKRLFGKSMWSLRKKIRFAIDSITSFSSWPLKLFGVLGVTLGLFCFVGIVVTAINYFSGRIEVPGWTSLIFTVLILASFQFVGFAVLGEYFWSGMEQNRKRPLFIIDQKIGFEDEPENSNEEPCGVEGGTVPLFSLQVVSQPIRNTLSETSVRVLRSSKIILGPEVERVERELGSFLGVRHVVGVANGTDAITLALLAAGVKPNDRVIVPAISAPATAVAVLRAQACPVFVDVDANTLLLDPAAIGQAVQGGARAIVPVHLYGNLCDMDAMLAIARTHQLAVVEDGAHSFGTRSNGKVHGVSGDFAAFSFYPTKNLGAYGDAGAIATNDDALASKLRQMRFYGLNEESECVEDGFNSRMDEIQAAFLSDRLGILDSQNEERMAIARRYDGALQFLNPIPSRSGRVPHLYVVRPENRNDFRNFLEQQGITTGVHYSKALPAHPYFTGHGIDAGTVTAREQCSHVVSLPCFPGLHYHVVSRIIRACLAWRERS